MLAKIIALMAHEIVAEYRSLDDDDSKPEPKPPAPPDAKIKIGFGK